MNTYFLEKMRVFEETLGIDKLMIQADNIRELINVSHLTLCFLITCFTEPGL